MLRESTDEDAIDALSLAPSAMPAKLVALLLVGLRSDTLLLVPDFSNSICKFEGTLTSSTLTFLSLLSMFKTPY